MHQVVGVLWYLVLACPSGNLKHFFVREGMTMVKNAISTEKVYMVYHYYSRTVH